MNTEFEPLFKLSQAERLQLVEDLWDSLVQEDADLSVSEEKRAELRPSQGTFSTASVIRSHVGAGEAAGTDLVLKQIQEAIQFHIEGLREDGHQVPAPSSSVEYVDVRAA
jgi:hypothetical protein